MGGNCAQPAVHCVLLLFGGGGGSVYMDSVQPNGNGGAGGYPNRDMAAGSDTELRKSISEPKAAK